MVLLPSAEADLRSARDFYASQDVRVGEYCLDSLLSDIDRLARRFPFSIYYRIIGDVVVVAAVLDNRRRVQLGDLLESIGRKARLTDDEAALFERDKSPVRDVSFD